MKGCQREWFLLLSVFFFPFLSQCSKEVFRSSHKKTLLPSQSLKLMMNVTRKEGSKGGSEENFLLSLSNYRWFSFFFFLLVFFFLFDSLRFLRKKSLLLMRGERRERVGDRKKTARTRPEDECSSVFLLLLQFSQTNEIVSF